jgi:hypothetical protein
MYLLITNPTYFSIIVSMIRQHPTKCPSDENLLFLGKVNDVFKKLNALLMFFWPFSLFYSILFFEDTKQTRMVFISTSGKASEKNRYEI